MRLIRQAISAFLTTCATVATSATLVAWQAELQAELQRIVAPPPPNGDPNYNFEVGGAVAISDEWAAVADKTVQDATGEVYMYRRTPGGWAFCQRIVGEKDSAFGAAVAIEGDTLAVGAFIWGGYLGKVWVFQWTGTTWASTQEITPEGLSSSESPSFGRSLALSGGVLVIGAPSVDHPVESGGEIRVYERPNSTWELVGRFQLPQNPEVLNGDYYRLGYSVAAFANTIVAGASGGYGAVYIYERNLSGWGRTAILQNPNPHTADDFGNSVDVSGDTLIVGEPAWHDIHSPSGRAYVYGRDTRGNWTLERELRASDGFGGGDYGDEFGGAVAIGGGRLFVGTKNSQSTGYKNGAVYVFNRHQDGWHATEDYQLVASKPPAVGFGQVGQSLDAYDNFILTGAPGSWDGGIREGVAYTFAVALGGSYCTASNKSGLLAITGSETAKDQRLILTVRDAPADARGLFLFSSHPGSYPFGTVTLCLGAPITRIACALTGPDGVAMHDINFGAPGLGELIAGSTWFFQCAHQCQHGTGPLELITNAVSLTLK